MVINNNDYQRDSNLSRVFEAVWRHPGISRVGIAHTLCSYRSTISNIIDTLIENNVICEGEQGHASHQSGRRPVCLFPEKSFGAFVGIELEPEQYALVVTDSTNTVLLKLQGETPYNETLINDPSKSFVWIVDKIIRDSMEQLNSLNVHYLGICMGIPGIVDIDHHIILRSDPFLLKNFNYGTAFDMRYNVPFSMENDANCCAWYQNMRNCNENIRTSLTILTKNYGARNLNRYPGNYTNSTGIGMAITYDGRVQYGKNYSTGEYISQSWRERCKGQTGLPDAVLNTILVNDDSYAMWARDFFSTLTTFVPLIAPEAIFLHGQSAKRYELLKSIIASEVPQFNAIIERTGTIFTIMDENPFEVAEGAAFMPIQHLFIIPQFQEIAAQKFIDWNSLFALSREKRQVKCPC
jgi:hypothetical protein